MSCLREKEGKGQAVLVQALLWLFIRWVELQLQAHQLMESKIYPDALIAYKYKKPFQALRVTRSEYIALRYDEFSVILSKHIANQWVVFYFLVGFVLYVLLNVHPQVKILS